MLECLLIGDEFAYELSLINQSCLVAYKPETTIENFLQTYQKFPSAKNTIISLGKNDSMDGLKLLPILRAKITGNVVWVLPPKTKVTQRKYIVDMAYELKDSYLEAPTKTNTKLQKYDEKKLLLFTNERQREINLNNELPNVWPPLATSKMNKNKDVDNSYIWPSRFYNTIQIDDYKLWPFVKNYSDSRYEIWSEIFIKNYR